MANKLKSAVFFAVFAVGIIIAKIAGPIADRTGISKAFTAVTGYRLFFVGKRRVSILIPEAVAQQYERE